MSQKVSRKAVSEEKEKRSTNSPVKDMKKKMAANAEKEKLAAVEKTDKVEKAPEKSTTEKSTEKSDKSDKPEKSGDKKSEKKTNADKKSDKPEPQAEKSKDDSGSKEDKSGKTEKEKPESKTPEPSKAKQNGRDRAHNGVSDVTLGNGTDDVLNGTVSADSEDDDVMLVIDDHDHDELFPELTYDDTSDVECFELPTPENAPSRSLTRRSQVKATRTPETPRPAERAAPTPGPESKEKLLKLKDDASSTDRKLRSADSPKPQEKKQDSDKKDESDKKESPKKQESPKKDKKESGKDVVGDKSIEESKSQEEKEVDVVIEIDDGESDAAQRKPDTNYSKSRVKVSPYRRSMRIADQTNSSVIANYTGNNTTMEMDITESSSFMDESNLDDSSYLRGLRTIRGRSSYKPLKEITLRHVANRSVRSNASVQSSSTTTEPTRPTGTVVGRKRKPSGSEREAPVEAGEEALPLAGGAKRLRVLERLTQPFRRVAAALPATHRRNAPIVGINTDLPLTAPVAAVETFDPESLKPPEPTDVTPADPLPTPVTPLTHQPDNKRCVVM